MAQYRKPDGTFTTDPSWAQHIAPLDVLTIWLQLSSVIPGRFIIGTVGHESGFKTNERDPGDQSDGSPSDGLTQCSRAEAIKAGKPLADLFDPEDNLSVFAITQHRNLDKLHDLFAKHPLDTPSDLWAWLSMCWNQGYGAVLKSVNANGASYSGKGGYRDRNKALVKPGFNGPNIIAYCDDVITGGKWYDPSWDSLTPSGGNVSDPLNVAIGIGAGVAAGLLLRHIATRT